MDRFSLSLLVGMVGVLVAAGIVYFLSGGRQVSLAVPTPTPAEVAPAAAPATAGRTPGESLDRGVLPRAAAMPTIAPSDLPIAFSAPDRVQPLPVPMTWSPPNFGKVVSVVYPGFTVVYSVTLANPLAVQYAMVGGAKPRRYPPPITVQTPKAGLIEQAGYQRGEMALQESISLYFGKAAGANTDLMTNLCAFNPACLAGPWAQFPALEERWAGTFGWIEIVAGPIFANPPARTANGLIVPAAFYRAYRRSFGDTIAFIIPQSATSTTLAPYLTSVGSVEAATGVSIFANTISPEQRVQVAKDLW